MGKCIHAKVSLEETVDAVQPDQDFNFSECKQDIRLIAGFGSHFGGLLTTLAKCLFEGMRAAIMVITIIRMMVTMMTTMMYTNLR